MRPESNHSRIDLSLQACILHDTHMLINEQQKDSTAMLIEFNSESHPPPFIHSFIHWQSSRENPVLIGAHVDRSFISHEPFRDALFVS